MKILDFDIGRGTFEFEVSNLITTWHSHPTIEILIATGGSFSIQTTEQLCTDLQICIVQPNIRHKVVAQKCDLHLLMFEDFSKGLISLLRNDNYQFVHGVLTRKECSLNQKIIDIIERFAKSTVIKVIEEARVKKSLELLDAMKVDYSNMMQTLTESTNLSESRISHLFKEHIGIAPKSYLQWSKLKWAFSSILSEGLTLTQAAHQYGFSDQAHLNRVFRKFMGIAPSAEYNSRTVQV